MVGEYRRMRDEKNAKNATKEKKDRKTGHIPGGFVHLAVGEFLGIPAI